jgi:hypothetical protein
MEVHPLSQLLEQHIQHPVVQGAADVLVRVLVKPLRVAVQIPGELPETHPVAPVVSVSIQPDSMQKQHRVNPDSPLRFQALQLPMAAVELVEADTRNTHPLVQIAPVMVATVLEMQRELMKILFTAELVLLES